MQRKYTLFIDESGESGISKVRTTNSPGASPYLTLGAALVPNDLLNETSLKLEKICEDLGKNYLHCQELNHRQKVYYARSIQNERVLYFGVISKKSTLGPYKEDIKSNSNSYYNKCAQYLLERVGLFMKENKVKPDQLSIIFEAGNFDYSALINLIKRCQETPLNSQVALLNYIDPLRIRKLQKHKAPLLQLADLSAHALYSCVNKSQANYHIPESRYLYELRSKFFKDKSTGSIIDRGVKPIHKLSDLGLDPEIHLFLSSLKAQ